MVAWCIYACLIYTFIYENMLFCICSYTNISTQIWVYTHNTFSHMNIYTYMYCVYILLYVYTHSWVYTHNTFSYSWVYTHNTVYTNIYKTTYPHIWIYMNIYNVNTTYIMSTTYGLHYVWYAWLLHTGVLHNICSCMLIYCDVHTHIRVYIVCMCSHMSIHSYTSI